MNRSSNLLDEAIGLEDQLSPSTPLTGRIVLIEDCVETSGAFVLHHLIVRSLSSPSAGIVIFVAFSQPFYHYERILRKLGCNLLAQKETNNLFFIDMHMLHSLEGHGGNAEDGLAGLYGKIQKIVEGVPESRRTRVLVMIDDISLLEVVADGSSNLVVDFLHYCETLTSEFGCSLVLLNHGDIYSSMERPALKSQMEYRSDILIKAEPLATGSANDVHGQLTVRNKGGRDESRGQALRNFQFRIREKGVEYFYAGSRREFLLLATNMEKLYYRYQLR